MIRGEHPLAADALGVMFTADSIRAIAANQKTQTRRLFSRGAVYVDGAHWSAHAFKSLRFDAAWVDAGPRPTGTTGPYLKVPYLDPALDTDDWKTYGTVHRVYPAHPIGTRWYIKEGWGIGGAWAVDPCLNYKALNRDDEHDQQPIDPQFMRTVIEGAHAKGKPFHLGDGWRSPLLMPRWAARYFLEITSVRFERVQSISSDDLTAEGIGYALSRLHDEFDHVAPRGETTWPTLPEMYERIWDNMHSGPHGKNGWAANPWVIVYTFKRLDT